MEYYKKLYSSTTVPVIAGMADLKTQFHNSNRNGGGYNPA